MFKKIIIAAVILSLGIAGYTWMNQPDPRSRSAASAPRPTATNDANGQRQAPATEQSAGNGGNSQGNQTNQTQRSAESSNSQGDQPATPTGSADQNSQAREGQQRPPRGGGFGGSGRLAQQSATSVEVVPAEANVSQAQLSVYGVVEAQTSIIISSTSTANVESINYQEGQLIQKGEALVSLSSPSALEQLTQRQASLQELDARLRNEALKHETDLAALEIEKELVRISKNSVDRFVSLNSQQLSTSNDYETALRSYQSQLLSLQNRELTLAQYDDNLTQWQAQRALLLSQIRQSEQLVDELTVEAPFDGLIAKLSVKEGQEVRAGDAIADVYDANSLALFVRVPIRYRLDQTNLTELSAIDSYGRTWQATAIRPLNELGAQRLTLKPSDEQVQVLPGSHISLTLSYPLKSAAVDVPITAVYDQQRVYVFDRETSTIKAIDVAILGRSATGYLIESDEFDRRMPIVTTRIKNPVTGMKVSLVRRDRGDRS
jgi:biotin carboxyl carrier protein